MILASAYESACVEYEIAALGKTIKARVTNQNADGSLNLARQ